MTQRKKPRQGALQRDPHHAREARKYDNPIPSREFIMELLDREGTPMDFLQLFEVLGLQGDEQQEALSRRLRAMERDGQLVMNRKGGYCLVDAEDLVAGRVVGHPDGFGFLVPDEGGDDLFLGPRQMRSLWHGDRAVARVVGVDRRGRREGALVEVLERAFTHVVGRLRVDADVGFVSPDNKRLTHEVLVPGDQLAGAKDGQMVVITLDRQPDRHRVPMGHVSEILGDHMAPGMETDVAIRAHDIPCDWPDEVLQETAKFGKTVPSRAKKDREDLRDVPLVTIDGEDSKDFDDAVFAKRTKSGWKLIVAIADVSHYVMPGSALDAEAIKRGNSVYFPDRVVPMLPEALSNGLCSINPKVDRLCMAAEILIKDNGEQTRSRFFPAVMRSHARLTYTKVAAMVVDGDPALCEEYAELLPHLHELYALYQALRAAREQRGAIDFDTTESRFVFDDKGKVASVRTVERNDAHKLIEECMLAANTAAARQLLRRKIPALYRNHERPSMEKLEDLRTFLHELGLSLGGGTEPTASDYAELLAKIQHRADAHMIQTVLLRSMMQAVYGNENVGHFGLSFEAYTHFTSPIRRYPDLMVHRALKHLIADGKPDDFDYSPHELASLGEHCSMTERRADEATRDSSDALKCEFMLDKVGQTFKGVVVSVTGFGLFVELEDIYITGLVHITALDKDFFHFDPIHHKLSGERTGKTYRLADTIEVKVAAVNLDDRKIDLVLAGADAPPEGEQRPPRRKKGRDRGPRGRKERGGERRASFSQRIDEPDEQPAEHPVAAEAPVAREPIEGAGKRRRGGKAGDRAAATAAEEPAAEAPEVAPAGRRVRTPRGRRSRREVPALLRPVETEPQERPVEVAVTETQPMSDDAVQAEPETKSKRRRKPRKQRGADAQAAAPAEQHDDALQSQAPSPGNERAAPKSKRRGRGQPVSETSFADEEIDIDHPSESFGNRARPDEEEPPEVDGNRVDYVPLAERKKPKRGNAQARPKAKSGGAQGKSQGRSRKKAAKKGGQPGQQPPKAKSGGQGRRRRRPRKAPQA